MRISADEGCAMEELPTNFRNSGAVEIGKRLQGISGGRILDVGTGSGDFIDTLMKTLKSYDFFVGIEISGKELESAKKRFEGQPVEFLEMDAKCLKFEDDSFDTVCVSYTLHHLQNIDKVLAEMKRVLKPGGYFVVQEEFSDGEQNEAQKTHMLQHHWGSEIDSLLGIIHNKTLTRQGIKDLVRSLRLSELEIFESEYAVRCLVCDKKFECQGKREVTIDQFAKEIDDDLRRLNEQVNSQVIERMRKDGEELKERMRKYGIASSPSLFLIGRKRRLN
jgi:ubiquinone/menaquinone biosynthesis C-methylase UbiE